MKKSEFLALAVIIVALAFSIPIIKKKMEHLENVKRFDQIEKILRKGSIQPVIDL